MLNFDNQTNHIESIKKLPVLFGASPVQIEFGTTARKHVLNYFYWSMQGSESDCIEELKNLADESIKNLSSNYWIGLKNLSYIGWDYDFKRPMFSDTLFAHMIVEMNFRNQSDLIREIDKITQ